MSNHGKPPPEWLNSEYIEMFLRTSTGDPNLGVQCVRIEPGSVIGDNYTCQIFRIELKLTNNQINEKFHFIIAKLKVEALHLMQMGIDVFEIETNYFTHVQPKIIEVLNAKKNGPKCFPTCHYIDTERKIIFLEDLKFSEQVEMQPRGKFLTLQQVELVVDALATFHAASSHVIKENPNVIKMFNDCQWRRSAPSTVVRLFENASKTFEKHIDKYNISGEWKTRLLRLKEDVENGCLKIYDRQEGQLNVLAHGDNWLNNIMFRFNEDVVEKVTLIDYQMVNYTSFANDLHYLLFTSAESDVIINNTNKLLKRYYEKFIEIAPDVPGVVFERIESEFHEKYYFGYLMMLTVRPFAVADETPDFQEMMEGKSADIGYNNPIYISDVEKLLPFLETIGVKELSTNLLY